MKLNIGGIEAKDGWKILNSQPGENIDYVSDIRNDLSWFASESCDEIYCSHVIEHLNQQQILQTLKEIRRMLRPGGRLMISVPDLDVLCKLFVHPSLNAGQRFHVMRMIFGGQVDAWDFHYIGLNLEILSFYLREAGFDVIEKVESFNLFNDTSNFKPYGVAISLNVVAQ
jgi:predicted SAM-dependent methyltransferase